MSIKARLSMRTMMIINKQTNLRKKMKKKVNKQLGVLRSVNHYGYIRKKKKKNKK